jgi:dihydroorotase
MSAYLFTHAHILDPVTGRDEAADVLVSDGVITAIGTKLDAGDAEAVDLNGAYLVPGLCDMHVHFRDPGFEYKEDLESGAAAAMAGGFTAVACMPNTDPPIDTAQTVRYLMEKAAPLMVDVLPIGAVTKARAGKELAPMAELRDAGAVAFSDDGSPVFNSKMMRVALEYSSMLSVPIIQHAEDPHLFEGGSINEGFTSTVLGLPGIPRLSEDTVVKRDIDFVAYLGGRYHVAHISTEGAVQAVREAKARGLMVTAEVAPHHFALTDEAVYGYDTNTKMNPPLRTQADLDAVLEALRDGTIDAIATDHAPHATVEKEVEYMYAPFGIIGLETSVGLSVTELVRTGVLTMMQLVEKMSTNPRRILGLPEIRIEEGAAANFTFIDADAEWTVMPEEFRSKSRNTPFGGRSLTGRPKGIFNKGRLHLA